MSIMKRISLSLAIVMSVVMLSGCIDFKVDLELNKDNTGKITALSAVDKEMAATFGDEDAPEGSISTVVDSLPVGLEGVTVERVPLNYKKGESTYEGEKVVVSFNDADAFFKEMAKDKEQTLKIIDLPNGNKRLEVTGIVQDETSADFDVYEIISELGGEMKFTLKTDFNVVNHNASSVNNRVYTWNMLDIILSDNNPEMSMFLEYVPENIKPLPSTYGKSRSEVEKSFGFDPASKDFHGNALSKLGILKGTDKGLELGQELTRVQGAIMYARLLGVESVAEKWSKENPNYKSGFTDVPGWAKPVIDYLHKHNFVKGVSDTLYGSNNIMSVNDYTTLVLRALGYNDSSGDFQWSSAGTKTQEIGLYRDDKVQPTNILGSKSFTRGSMSYVSYNALFFQNSKTGERLIDNLIK